MQLLLVLFFLPLLLLFLSFSIFRPDSKIIYRNGLGFLLDYFIFFFYRVTFRTRVFLRRKEIDIWEDFFRRKSRSLISNISIRNGIVIIEFFLITDNLSIYVRWKIKSQKILKILEFESISDGATINSIEFEIFLFFFI